MTAPSLPPSLPPSLIVFTGKGGVGKTTCAAATALRMAREGQRVLVVSTDPAHSLGDCLQMKLGCDPVPVIPGLTAMELDAVQEMRSKFTTVSTVLVEQMQRHGLSSLLAEEMVAFPGAEELFSLLRILDAGTSGEFDAVVMDTAPTGNTMRFLNFPAFLKPVQTALKVDQVYNKLTRPLAHLLGGDRPKDAFYAAIFQLFEEVERARRYLLDADVRFRLVLTPEKLAVVETQRAISFLNISGYLTDAIIFNKVIPAGITDPFFAGWKEAQRTCMDSAGRSFHPLPLLQAPLWHKEVLGAEMLSEFAEVVYGGLSPSARLCDSRLFEVRHDPGGVQLRIQMPHDDRSEIKLFRKGQDLVARIGYFEKVICLPTALQVRALAGAHFEGNLLVVAFE